MPLWAFDLAERQIMQTSIAEKERGVVNSVEGSLTNIFTFFASLLGVIVSDPENYAVLAIVSQLAIASAAICFGIYGAKNWDKELEPNAAEEIEMWKADDNELLESPGGLFTIVDEDEEWVTLNDWMRLIDRAIINVIVAIAHIYIFLSIYA